VPSLRGWWAGGGGCPLAEGHWLVVLSLRWLQKEPACLVKTSKSSGWRRPASNLAQPPTTAPPPHQHHIAPTSHQQHHNITTWRSQPATNKQQTPLPTLATLATDDHTTTPPQSSCILASETTAKLEPKLARAVVPRLLADGSLHAKGPQLQHHDSTRQQHGWSSRQRQTFAMLARGFGSKCPRQRTQAQPTRDRWSSDPSSRMHCTAGILPSAQLSK
jgi:hypothetical protein